MEWREIGKTDCMNNIANTTLIITIPEENEVRVYYVNEPKEFILSQIEHLKKGNIKFIELTTPDRIHITLNPNLIGIMEMHQGIIRSYNARMRNRRHDPLDDERKIEGLFSEEGKNE